LKMTGPGRLLLLGTAVFAFAWALARAATQSIVIDEADTYLSFVAPLRPLHWYPAANNHILNSILMRLSTSVFGVNHLSVRAPALLGAAIYITAGYVLCRLLTSEIWLQWCLFVCLVYNPFVFDYFVAARGYGLADAFLLSGVTFAAWRYLRRITDSRTLRTNLFWSSCCFGLVIAANFSFAIVAIAATVLCYVSAANGLRHQPRETPVSRLEYLLLAIAAAVPAILAAFFFCGYTAFRFPRSELVFGTKSLFATVSSVVNDSLYELNPDILNPLLLPLFRAIQPGIFPALVGTSLICVVIATFDWRHRSAIPSRRLATLSAFAAFAIVLTLGVHRLLFHFFRILLPLDRTALYLVPLGTIALGSLTCFSRSSSRLGRLGGRALAFVLLCLAVYFLFSLRLRYFQEWRYDADVREAYSVLSCLNQRFGIKRVPSNWRYSSSLNFYRAMSRTEDFDLFEYPPSAYPPSGYLPSAAAFVLYIPEDQAFIEKNSLMIAYRGELTDMVIATNPRVVNRSPSLIGCSQYQ
jgi:hypothetical protein